MVNGYAGNETVLGGPKSEAEAWDLLGLMTPGEVAGILHVDANTVARWANGGKLRAVRTPGGHRRYYAREVLQLARQGSSQRLPTQR